MTIFPLTDVHCHLQNDRFAVDLSQVIVRAELVGVTRFVCNTTAPSDWEKTLQLARDYPNVLPCLGLHPLHVGAFAASPGDTLEHDWLDQLAELLEKASRELPQPVAIGEIGLDHYVETRDDALQESVFREQLHLAARLQKPVMLHTRRALDRSLEILCEFCSKKSIAQGGIPAFLLHGFGGPTERVDQIVNMGGYFSFSANILKIKHKKMRQAAAIVPLDRVLLESDAPDLPPPNFAIPKNWPVYKNIAPEEAAEIAVVRNEPSILPAILVELAALRNIPVGELAGIIAENEAAFFEKW